MLLEDYTQVLHDTWYHKNTPKDLVRLLDALYQTKQRVMLVYGNIFTGVPWDLDANNSNRGFIGKSSGSKRVPLLVKTSRSPGGDAILDLYILQIRDSRGGKVLYNRPIKTPKAA